MATTDPVLVTGIGGVLGRRVVSELLQRGHQVIGLNRRNPEREEIAAQLAAEAKETASFEMAWTDVTDAEGLRKLFAEKQPGTVIHLAAVIPPGCFRDPAMARRVNVDGTANLLAAGKELAELPFFVHCSSNAVYGMRNPHESEPCGPDTPVDPASNYGAHKVEAERLVRESGLPYSILRLAAIMSPDLMGVLSKDALVLDQAFPRDQKVHSIDVRDAAIAFANATKRGREIDGRIFMIAGDDSNRMLHRELADDLMVALGMRGLGPKAALPGDPNDARGWADIDWFDTAESQQELTFQEHLWSDTLEWMGTEVGGPLVVRKVAGVVARPLMLGYLAYRRKRDGRVDYADPWKFLTDKFGESVVDLS